MARRWLWWLVLLGVLLVVISRFTNLQHLGDALARAHWSWIVVATLLHAAFFLLHGNLYRLGFQAVGVSSTVAGLLPVFFASTYLNAVAPSGGTAGAAVFVADAKRRGESPARAAVGTVVVLIADLATLLPFLAGGLLFLARRGRLAYYDLLGASLYVVFVSGLVLALTLARHRVRFLTRALGWIERLVARVAGWFRRSSPLGANWAHRVATDLSAAAVAVFGKPRIVAQLVLAGTALHVVNLLGLYALFLAFEQPLGLSGLGTGLAGFSLGIVFYVIAIIPQGLAAVEGIMGLVFTSLAMPAAPALGIILAFRGMNFWLPLVLGLFFVRRLPDLGSGGGHDAGDRASTAATGPSPGSSPPSSAPPARDARTRTGQDGTGATSGEAGGG
ncbi:MAG: lysylphosphatidylglycerol synthase transmembrane domain-containing protein [Deinococcales bacterium]